MGLLIITGTGIDAGGLASRASARLTKDGHSPVGLRMDTTPGRNMFGQLLHIHQHWADVAMQQSFNEDAPPCAQVKPKIKELVDPRILATCQIRSTPKLSFIKHRGS